ncbi:MAG: site-specific integrase [Ruminococcaceae bacterium]|nr:site-specific integrase [Oscillospiraceae bacterium]
MPIYKENGSKDGKQKYRVVVNYTDNFGKYQKATRIAYGKAEAKELEARLEFEVKETPTVSGITVKQLLDLYVSAKKGEVKESTVNKNKTRIEQYVLGKLGDKRVKKLTVPMFQEWKNEVDNMNNQKNGNPLSLRYKQNIYSALRSLLNWGVEMDYIPKNNLLKVKNFKDPNEFPEKPKIDFYTVEEYKLFLSAALNKAQEENTHKEWGYYVFFAIAFYMGMRKGEIHALKWTDIKDGYIHINRSINQKEKGGDRETRPKSYSSARIIQIPFPLLKILQDHKKRYMTYPGFNDNFRVCGGAKPLRDTTIENRNKEFAKTAAIKKIRIHDFRHSHASLLANEGINIQEIARRLGHAKVEETWNTYSHLYPREEERATKVLNKIS